MRKMPIASTLAALALLVGNSIQAEAQKGLFETLDTDANGSISVEEASANPALHARWQELDGDKNNQLDKSEFSAFETGKGEMMQEGGMMDKGGRME